MSKRQEFSPKTKLAAFERAHGHCETCGCKIITRAEYDHIIEDYIGGDNTLSNCRVLCPKCHTAKTRKSRPAIDKTRRLVKDIAGVTPRRSSFQTNRNGRFKKRMDGSVVKRD
jgi:5-methylcytosine-specific restriction protein A